MRKKAPRRATRHVGGQIVPIEFRIAPADPKLIERNIRAIAGKLGPVAAAFKDEGLQVEFVADNAGGKITVSLVVTAFTFAVKVGGRL